jgi:hypothetical protein
MPHYVEDFVFAVVMVFDQLIRAVPMVVIDGTMRREHRFHVKGLYLALRGEEIAERVGGTLRI